MTDYDALRAFGHSPTKAAEVVLDASRGDWFCQKWIAHAQEVARMSATADGLARAMGGRFVPDPERLAEFRRYRRDRDGSGEAGQTAKQAGPKATARAAKAASPNPDRPNP